MRKLMQTNKKKTRNNATTTTSANTKKKQQEKEHKNHYKNITNINILCSFVCCVYVYVTKHKTQII